jgi:hypothetical protein
MQEALDRLLREATLVTIALGIGLGWSLFQVAQGVATAVNGLLTKYPASDLAGYANSQPLTWIVHGRVLTLGSLLAGVVELAVVMAVAMLLTTRARSHAD